MTCEIFEKLKVLKPVFNLHEIPRIFLHFLTLLIK